MIYFDNAATSYPKAPGVKNAMVYALDHYGNASRSSYLFSRSASLMLWDFREHMAEFVGLKIANNVILCSGATHALNMAIQGALASSDHVITTVMEHNSVLRPLYQVGCDLDMISLDSKGNLKLSQLELLKRKATKAVVCTHASNVTGGLNDLYYIGDFCKKNNLIFIVDAAQTAGIIPIDMHDMKIDILCLAGHKSLLGPQGTGVLCLKEGLDLEPLLYGGTGGNSYEMNQPNTYPERLEAGTQNSCAFAGLSASLEYIKKNMRSMYKKEMDLTDRFLRGISHLKLVKIYGDFSIQRTAIVSINIGNIDSGEISALLDEKYGMATRAGAHCAPLMHKALNTQNQGVVRFSFSSFNTENEIDIAIFAINQLCDQL